MAARRSPTVHTPAPSARSAATTYSKPTVWTPPSSLLQPFPRPAWAGGSRCARLQDTGDEDRVVAPAALAGARGFELGFKRVKRVERLRELLAQLGQGDTPHTAGSRGKNVSPGPASWFSLA